MRPPRRLSVSKLSPAYDKDWIHKIDEVRVDGVHLPFCCYYDMDKGEARGKNPGENWGPMMKGVITVTVKNVS